MDLKTRDRGYAVMNKELTGISLSGYSIEELKPYCRKDSVIAERIPKVCGFSIKVLFFKYHKPFHFRYNMKNILWLHWIVSTEYCHKTGEIVYTPNNQ